MSKRLEMEIKMKRLGFAIFGLLFGITAMTMAASSTTQVVTFEVKAINEISVSGGATVTVDTATAGSDPTDGTDATTTYNITTNESNKKITGEITTGGNMPTGLTLTANLTPPPGASASTKSLSSGTAEDLVTGITQVKGSSLGITYTLSATLAAGVVASDTRTVTLTLTD